MAWPCHRGSTGLTQNPPSDLVQEPHVFCNWNESHRWNERSVLFGEAYQRLEPNEVPVRHFTQRLIVQLESIVDDSVADNAFKLDACLQLGVHFRQEEPDTIATVCLASIECEICTFQQSLRGDAVGGRDRDPDAYSRYDLMVIESCGRRDHG